MNDQLENENENGSRVWSISCATSWWQSSLALGPLLRPYSQSCGGHRPRTLHEHSWGLECLKDKLPQRWFDGKNLFPHLVQDNIPKFGKRLPLPFMVGSPTSQTHTKKKKQERSDHVDQTWKHLQVLLQLERPGLMSFRGFALTHVLEYGLPSTQPEPLAKRHTSLQQKLHVLWILQPNSSLIMVKQY